MRNNDTTAQLKLDTTSHINPEFNRTIMKGNFMFVQGIDYLTHEQRIRLMRAAKERIRHHDAQPAAWFYKPDRATWAHARWEAGEFDGQPPEVLGRAFMGEAA
ncbi:hypothetical protein OCT51_11120 [Halomonas sp. LR3S48]|uniref:hypothetical protein n=1 Tax=Halomonas sp. LR3S48 TaxID=2982694 RepID=UPI0021E43A43|nr:hypothetical protein [Halomonas sp. LR3S48]UYG01764.1 hypothetical protein OCT51_11120 [Halomonas sp. LR3S48]